ncbi:MAG TPA: GMC family oxidoreductase [Devosia sp.]|nr:GMC family oxidoreductase [Devosia sp.]
MTPAIDMALLRAVLDRIVPGDRDPSATGFGADAYVLERLLSGEVQGAAMSLVGLGALDEESRRRHGRLFAELPPGEQDALLEENTDEAWFKRLCELTAEGVYADAGNGGNRGFASWPMVGYEHRLPDGPQGAPGRDGQKPRAFTPGLTEFDAIVVGAGAGGGITASVLAEAGKTVLLVERGVERDYADSGRRDHLRNHRLSQYGQNTGPDDGQPRVAMMADGTERSMPPHESLYQNIAAAVGGGTLVYGMQAWRFHPTDFAMASTYGVPEGSSLADWPIGYDELAPYYERAEWEIGVAGDSGADRNSGARARAYPMPGTPDTAATAVLRRGAAAMGIDTFRVPLLLNTTPYGGRSACIACGSCIGFPCPVDAKNGSQNSVLSRAMASGRITLVTGAMVRKVETGDDGRVTGVSFTDADGRTHQVRARAVVLAGGAIETARLLLNSANAREPNGLGNNSDHVGRHLQGHVYPTAWGLFDEEVHGSRGPGVSIATTKFSHGNPGVIGGAMLADDFNMLPIIFWKSALPPDQKRWGRSAKDFMRAHFHHILQVKGPVQEIPDPDSRVTVSRDVRDRFGLPVARLSGSTHDETMRTAAFMFERAQDWVRASGARKVWGQAPRPRLSGGQHQAGTARMGTDPANSVTDKEGRVWGHDNLFVTDGSLHPTNGGFNPVLTIMALAFRNAEVIARWI